MNLLPRTLFGRLVLLLAGGLAIAQLIGAAMHMSERQKMLSTTVNGEFAQRVAAVYRAINHQPTTQRAQLAQQLSAPRQQLSIETQAPVAPESHLADNQFVQRVRSALGADIALQPQIIPQTGAFSFDLYLQLSGGDWLRIKGQAPPEIFALPVHHFMTLGVMLIAVFLLVWLIVRMTVRPLTDLASAADDAIDPNHLLGTLLKHLTEVLTAFEQGGFAALREEWTEHHAYHEQHVRMLMPDGREIHGVVHGITEDGSLLVITAEGVQRFISGEISLRGA